MQAFQKGPLTKPLTGRLHHLLPALPSSLFNKRWQDKMSNEEKHTLDPPEGQEGPHRTAHPTTQPAIWSSGGGGPLLGAPAQARPVMQSDTSIPTACEHELGALVGPQGCQCPHNGSRCPGTGLEVPHHPELPCEFDTPPQPRPEALQRTGSLSLTPKVPNRTEEGS